MGWFKSKLFTHKYECPRCFNWWKEQKTKKQYKKDLKLLVDRQIEIMSSANLCHLPNLLKNIWDYIREL